MTIALGQLAMMLCRTVELPENSSSLRKRETRRSRIKPLYYSKDLLLLDTMVWNSSLVLQNTAHFHISQSLRSRNTSCISVSTVKYFTTICTGKEPSSYHLSSSGVVICSLFTRPTALHTLCTPGRLVGEHTWRAQDRLRESKREMGG